MEAPVHMRISWREHPVPHPMTSHSKWALLREAMWLAVGLQPNANTYKDQQYKQCALSLAAANRTSMRTRPPSTTNLELQETERSERHRCEHYKHGVSQMPRPLQGHAQPHPGLAYPQAARARKKGLWKLSEAEFV